VGKGVAPAQRDANIQVGAQAVSQEIGLRRRLDLFQVAAARSGRRTTGQQPQGAKASQQTNPGGVDKEALQKNRGRPPSRLPSVYCFVHQLIHDAKPIEKWDSTHNAARADLQSFPLNFSSRGAFHFM
jgi:hypothetical protein